MAATQAKAEEVFLAILARFTAAGRVVSDSKQGSYGGEVTPEMSSWAPDGKRGKPVSWRVLLVKYRGK